MPLALYSFVWARELLESRKGMIVFVRVMAVLTTLTALLFLI